MYKLIIKIFEHVRDKCFEYNNVVYGSAKPIKQQVYIHTDYGKGYALLIIR